MKVVITDCDHPDVDSERRIFAKAGFGTVLASCRTEADVIVAGQGASALLTQYAPVTAAVLDALPDCQAVGRYGVGVDNIDVAAASACGVAVISVPDYSLEEVANHTIALILAAARGIVALHDSVRAGRWDFRAAGPLRRSSGQVLGIVGLGHIGAAVASRAQALGFTVAGHDPVQSVPGVSHLPLHELLMTSDIITLHAPVTAATRHLLNDETFALMKPGAALVNTARGGLVDPAALRRALGAGRISGAALDVTDPEPPEPDDPLLQDPRVIITPHTAFYSEESLAELKRRAAEGLVAAVSPAEQ